MIFHPRTLCWFLHCLGVSPAFWHCLYTSPIQLNRYIFISSSNRYFVEELVSAKCGLILINAGSLPFSPPTQNWEHTNHISFSAAHHLTEIKISHWDPCAWPFAAAQTEFSCLLLNRCDISGPTWHWLKPLLVCLAAESMASLCSGGRPESALGKRVEVVQDVPTEHRKRCLGSTTIRIRRLICRVACRMDREQGCKALPCRTPAS